MLEPIAETIRLTFRTEEKEKGRKMPQLLGIRKQARQWTWVSLRAYVSELTWRLLRGSHTFLLFKVVVKLSFQNFASFRSYFFPSTVSSFFLFDFFLYCYKKKQIICIYVFIYVNIYVCIKVLNLHFEPPAPCERFHDTEQ